MKIKLSDGTEVDPNDSGLKSFLEKMVGDAVTAATAPLAKNRDDLLNEKKTLAEKLKAFDGIEDPEKVKAILGRIANDEETRLISEGKVDEVVNRRVENLKRDLEAKATAAQKLADESTASLTKAQARIADMMISDGVRSAATKVGAHPTAIDDMILRARGMFKVEEDKLVARGEGDKPLFGKDGKSPLSIDEWADGLKEKAPHLFAKPSGTGGTPPGQGQGAGGGQFTLTREQARDRATWNETKAAAEKAGQTVTVVD